VDFLILVHYNRTLWVVRVAIQMVLDGSVCKMQKLQLESAHIKEIEKLP
jgi:hypothetical protein